jgi:RNA polymerase sigma factor (sigma-70 family)
MITLDTLYTEHEKQARFWLAAKCHDRELAEDIIHTAFARLCAHWDRYEVETLDDGKHLLGRIIKRLYIDHVRSMPTRTTETLAAIAGRQQDRRAADMIDNTHGQHKVSMLIDGHRAFTDPTDIEADILRYERNDEMETMILGILNEREQRAIAVFVQSGGCCFTVARYLGITHRAAKSYIHRIKGRLRAGMPRQSNGKYKHKFWTADEDALIIDTVRSKNDFAIAQHLGRSVASIYNRRRLLKQKGVTRTFPPDWEQAA